MPQEHAPAVKSAQMEAKKSNKLAQGTSVKATSQQDPAGDTYLPLNECQNIYSCLIISCHVNSAVHSIITVDDGDDDDPDEVKVYGEDDNNDDDNDIDYAPDKDANDEDNEEADKDKKGSYN